MSVSLKPSHPNRALQVLACGLVLGLVTGCASDGSGLPAYNADVDAIVAEGFVFDRIERPDGFSTIGHYSTNDREDYDRSFGNSEKADIDRGGVLWFSTDPPRTTVEVHYERLNAGIRSTGSWLPWEDAQAKTIYDGERLQYRVEVDYYRDLVHQNIPTGSNDPLCAAQVVFVHLNLQRDERTEMRYIEGRGERCHDLNNADEQALIERAIETVES